MNKFAERLKELREENNLSQRSLAKELNVSRRDFHTQIAILLFG